MVEVTLIRGGGVLHGRNTGPPNSATTTWGALAFNVTRYVGVESEASMNQDARDEEHEE